MGWLLSGQWRHGHWIFFALTAGAGTGSAGCSRPKSKAKAKGKRSSA